MITVNDIYNYINEIAPFDSKCSWDNCGVLIGNKNAVVKKAGFALDLTPRVLLLAEKESVDLIVTHHPVIFRPQSNFLEGNIAYEAAVRGINVLSAHTNYDCAEDGVSRILAEYLGLTDIVEVETEEKPSCVRIGTVADEGSVSPEAFADFVAKRLDTTIRLAQGKKSISKVAVCGGSGGDFLYDVLAAGADAYVTGDLSHHHFLAAEETGMTIIAAGHFETENISVKPLMNKIGDYFRDTEVILLKQENPVKFIR